MNSSTFNSKSMLKAYGLAASLIVLAHLGITFSDSVWRELYRVSVPSRDDALRVEANMRLSPKDASTNRIVLMGSSQTREDFDVDYLNRRFRDRGHFINLGFSGNGNPIEMYMLTPRVVDMKPKLVVYMPFIGSLFRPYAYQTFDLYFDPNILPLIRSIHGWSELADRADIIAMGIFRRASILFRHRNSYQQMVDDAINRLVRGSPAKVAQTYAYHRRKPNSHFMQLIETHRKSPRYREHQYQELYQEAFRMMVQYLTAQNVLLLVVDGPTHPLIKHFYDPRLNSEYELFMSNTSTTYGFTRLRKSDLPEFRDDDFNDFTHLNASGRARFNAFIADYLQENAARLGLAQEPVPRQ